MIEQAMIKKTIITAAILAVAAVSGCAQNQKPVYKADSIHGPWEFKGLLSECAGNCNTTHPAIVELNGRTYFFTHNGTLPEGTSYSRSVCVEEVIYNPDGTMQKCDVTKDGIW